ncbi:MAG: hypothetical protein J6T36_03455, partial [Campylobacter sp.]|nr:hypothetical protein [Campylobacter sp.]
MNNIFDYALNSIFRYGLKNILITIIFGILVFLLSSVIFITNSLKAEYKGISANLPDILVQRYYGGKVHFIDEKMVDEFLLMPSVSSVQPRIWGQYHFERESVYLTLFGVQSYQKHFDKSIDEIATNLDNFDGDFMVASKRVYEFLQKYFRAHDLVLVPFFTPDGDLISLKKGGIFKSESSLLNNDIILLSEENARKILGIPNGQFTDILLEVANKAEVDFLADKIRRYHHDLRVITKSEMLRKYENLYDFKSGWFLALLVWVFAGGGCWLAAAGEDGAEPSKHDPGFREWFFAKNGLDKLRDVQTVYPASVRDNLAHASALSTKDYLLASSQTKTGMLEKPGTDGKGCHHFCSWLWAGTGTEPPTTGGHYYWDRWQVIDTTPANYGAVVAKLKVLACPDSREMINEYCGYWICMSQMGFNQYVAGFKRNDALRLGDLALCWRILKLEEKDGAERFAIDYSRWKNPQDVPPGIAVPEEIHIDLFRNGVVVMAWGKDSGNFRYLRFLRDLDALLRHDGAGPAPAPGALTPDEYRQSVEKYWA